MADDDELTAEQIAALDAEGRAGDDGNGEQGDGEAGGGAGDPSPAPPPSPEQIERKLSQIDKAFLAYSRKVEQIMGDDFANLIVSPFDWRPGFIWHPEFAPPEPPALAAMQALLGSTDARDLNDAPDAQACATCNAWGVVRTGSKAEGQETKMCPDCSGAGWRPAAPPQQPVTAAYPGGNGGAPALAPNQIAQVADRWGRPAGHPHYGIDPAQVFA